MEHLRPVLLVFPNKTLRALSQQKQSNLSTSSAGAGGKDGRSSSGGHGREDHSREVSHNEVERKRKLKISQGIKQLSELLQETCSCGKQTRGEVLQKAVDKIKCLQEENEKLKADVASLPELGTEEELYVKLAELMIEHLQLRLQLQEYFDKQNNSPESSEKGVCTHDHTPYTSNKPSEQQANVHPSDSSSPTPALHSQNETTSASSQHWSVTSLLSCDQQPMSCDQQESSTSRFPVLDSNSDLHHSSCQQHTYTHTPTQTHPHCSHTPHQSRQQQQPSGVIVQPWVGGSGHHVIRPWTHTHQQDTHSYTTHHGTSGMGSYSHQPRGGWRSSQEYQEGVWQRNYHHQSERHLDTGRHTHLNSYRRHGNEMPHPYIGHSSLPIDPTMCATNSRTHTHGSSYLQGHMMSCDLTTPPYPLPPAHPTSNSAVWRPYSEPHRTSGFCLADILSLNETDTQQLHLEPTPTVSNKFFVGRLLDDI